jgi:hypothetical protein
MRRLLARSRTRCDSGGRGGVEDEPHGPELSLERVEEQTEACERQRAQEPRVARLAEDHGRAARGAGDLEARDPDLAGDEAAVGEREAFGLPGTELKLAGATEKMAPSRPASRLDPSRSAGLLMRTMTL